MRPLLDRLLHTPDPQRLLEMYPRVAFDTPDFRQQVAAAEAAARRGPEAFVFSATGAALQVGSIRYAAGAFSTPSLGELKARLAPGSGRPVKLSILLGVSRLNDIQFLEAHADGDTLFQLASQFNGLEAPGPSLVPVGDYFDDHTQGPLGVLPTFPGALLRHYAAPGSQGQHFVQGADQQVNFLADVLPAELGKVQNGYLVSQQIAQPEALAAKLVRDFDAIRMGVHRHLEVMGTGAVLDQVLTSSLAGGAYSQANTLEGPWLEIQRQLLRAAYLGTLLAAADGGQHKVVLTAIGGGVFANPHTLIWEALLWALEEIQPYLRAPLHVILNLRNFDVAPERLQAEVQRRQGHWVRF